MSILSHSTANPTSIRVSYPIYLMEQVLYGTWPKCLQAGRMKTTYQHSSNTTAPHVTSLPNTLGQSSVNPMSIHCKSVFEGPLTWWNKYYRGTTEVSQRMRIQTIHVQRNATPAQIISATLPILDQYVNPRPICQSNATQTASHIHIPRPYIHQRQSLKMHCHKLAVHWQALAQITSIPCQSENSSASDRGTSILCGPTEVSPRRTISQAKTRASQISKSYFQIDTAYVNSASIQANQTPIQVTIPHLVKGTSTIRSQLLSGRHHFQTTVRCPHNVNPRTIKCQSIISMMPTVRQSIANPVPVNCQSISNAVPTRCQYGANVNSGPIQQSIINMPILYQSNANPGPICQSITNQPI